MIWITHRLTTARRADKIAMIEDGVSVTFFFHFETFRLSSPRPFPSPSPLFTYIPGVLFNPLFSHHSLVFFISRLSLSLELTLNSLLRMAPTLPYTKHIFKRMYERAFPSSPNPKPSLYHRRFSFPPPPNIHPSYLPSFLPHIESLTTTFSPTPIPIHHRIIRIKM